MICSETGERQKRNMEFKVFAVHAFYSLVMGWPTSIHRCYFFHSYFFWYKAEIISRHMIKNRHTTQFMKRCVFFTALNKMEFSLVGNVEPSTDVIESYEINWYKDWNECVRNAHVFVYITYDSMYVIESRRSINLAISKHERNSFSLFSWCVLIERNILRKDNIRVIKFFSMATSTTKRKVNKFHV